MLQASVDEKTGSYLEWSLTALVRELIGDNLAFDEKGNAYVATNPMQTIMKLDRIGLGEQIT